MIILYIILFIIAIVVLIKSGSILVKSLSQIAWYLKLNEFAVAFLLIALATSTPELFVGVAAAIRKVPVLSLGTILGANIINLTLVIGLPVLLARGIKFSSKIIYKDILNATLVGVCPCLLLLDKTLSRVDGVILLLILSFYFWLIGIHQRKFTKEFKEKRGGGLAKNLLLFLVGIFLLLCSAGLLVYASKIIAQKLDLSLLIIGTILVALGTTLPELIFGTRAVLTGHKEMAVGNALGSVVINSTLVLGIVALIRPIVVADFTTFLIAAIFFIVVSLIFAFFAITKKELSWREGFALIIIYVIFVAFQFFPKILGN